MTYKVDTKDIQTLENMKEDLQNLRKAYSEDSWFGSLLQVVSVALDKVIIYSHNQNGR